jgi:hypothetical protein
MFSFVVRSAEGRLYGKPLSRNGKGNEIAYHGPGRHGCGYLQRFGQDKQSDMEVRRGVNPNTLAGDLEAGTDGIIH